MAISSNGLAGLKPGVVDNTASRPSAPFEGQMIFQKDTDQLLIWNGTAWVIPNSPAQNPQGLELITTGALSSAVNFEGCFSATYTNYRIVVNVDTHTGGAVNIQAFPLLGSTPNTTAANYSNVGMEQPIASGWTITTFGKSGTGAGWEIGRLNGDGASGTFIVDIFNPFVSVKTYFKSEYIDGGQAGRLAGLLSVTTSYDGIRFTGPTMTGTVSVYGYRK